MPTCAHCGTSSETAALDRHEVDGLLMVRCPDCHFPMGVWRDRSLRIASERP
jgi:hypothetical protein